MAAAASKVWADQNVYEKWESFWGCWALVLGKMRLKNACDCLGTFFRGKELLMLAVHPGFRGHLEHVLHVYFTGYVLSHCEGFKELVLKAVHDLIGSDYNASADEEYWSLFQVSWLMVATLHDVAYPLEMLPDVVKQSREIRNMCAFAEFEGTIDNLVPKGVKWESDQGKAARGSFRFIFEQLYKNSALADQVERHVVYPKAPRAGDIQRYNHGIASGILFRSQADEWSAGGGLRPEFVKWSAVAMGVHSLKNAAEEVGLKVAMEQDPLAFLLCLADELQVWNRSRPDETMASAQFRGIELVGLGIDGAKLTATVEYDLFPAMDEPRRNSVVGDITKRLEKDQKLLSRFLVPKPFQVIIKSKLRGLDAELPEIRLT